MADNILVTAGEGTTVSTDDIGGVHYQEVKLIDGTADSATPIAVDVGVKANALRVAPANDITDATYIGDIKFGEAEPNSAAILADTAAMVVDLAAIEVLLGTIDADTSTIAGDTTSIDGKITACNTGAVVVSSGTLTAVTAISNALPAGTNAIGKLAANSGVDIGDVDVTSVVPGTAAANLGKAEDAAHSTGDVGVMALGVENEDQADLSTGDKDYTPIAVTKEGNVIVKQEGAISVTESSPISGFATSALQLADGHNVTVDNGASAAAVNIQDGGNSITVDNGGTFVVQEDGAALTALQLIDDPVFADNAAFTLASSKLMMAGAIRDDSLTTLDAVDGDAVPLRVGSTGALHVTGGGGGTEYTEDVATANPQVGTATMIERDDQLAAVTPIEGDWIGLRGTEKGALWVALADASGDPITAFGGGTEYTEDVATANPQVGKAIMVERDDALTSVTPAEGDWIGLRGSAEGALWTQDFNSDAILADTAAMVVDLAAIEVLLGTIDTDTGAIAVDIAANEVLLTTIAGDTTSIDADTTTIIGHVDGIETLLGTIDADTSTLAGAVAAGQMQVDIVADGAGLATAANQLADGHNVTIDNGASAAAVNIQDGGNSITIDGSVTADLGANNDVTIDGSSVVYAEDTASQAADDGVMILARRTASPADTSGADLDYESLQMDNGRLWTSTTIDAALPAGDNNIGNVDIASSVALDVSAATVTVDLGANNDVTVTSGAITETNSTAILADTASMDTNLGTIAGDTTSIDGKITACNTGAVVLSSGTVTTVSTLSAITGLTMLNAGAQVTGDEANDAADAGNPVKIGGRAQDIIGAEPEEVADNDRVDALFDQNGRIGVTAGSDYKYADINDSTSGNNTIVAAQAAGKRIAVWSIMIVSDGTVDCRFEDGAGGTAFTGQIPLQEREGYTYSSGGLVPLFVGSAATLLNLELSAAVNVHGSLSYTVIED